MINSNKKYVILLMFSLLYTQLVKRPLSIMIALIVLGVIALIIYFATSSDILSPSKKTLPLNGSVAFRGALTVMRNGTAILRTPASSPNGYDISLAAVTEGDTIQLVVTGTKPAIIGSFTWNGDTKVTNACGFQEATVLRNERIVWADAKSYEENLLANSPGARWVVPRNSESNSMTLSWVVAVKKDEKVNTKVVTDTFNGKIFNVHDLEVKVIGVNGVSRTPYPRTRVVDWAAVNPVFPVTTGEKVVFTVWNDSWGGVIGGHWTWNGKTYNTSYCDVFEEELNPNPPMYGFTNQQLIAKLSDIPEGVVPEFITGIDGNLRSHSYTWTAK